MEHTTVPQMCASLQSVATCQMARPHGPLRKVHRLLSLYCRSCILVTECNAVQRDYRVLYVPWGHLSTRILGIFLQQYNYLKAVGKMRSSCTLLFGSAHKGNRQIGEIIIFFWVKGPCLALFMKMPPLQSLFVP